MAQQKVRYSIRKGYKKEKIEKIAQLAIELIQSRTNAGFDRYDSRFARYSKEYAAEKGVSRSNVDLVKTGEMLDALEVLAIGSDWFELGYPKGSSQEGKVEGNRLGTYGNSSPVTKPRDFLGLSDKELNFLMSEYPMDEVEQLDSVFEDAVDRIVNNRPKKLEDGV